MVHNIKNRWYLVNPSKKQVRVLPCERTPESSMLSALDVTHYNTFGFLLLRQAFDPSPLSRELDLAMQQGFPGEEAHSAFIAGQAGRYLPMMCEQTPTSLALLLRFHELASQLLQTEALPVRAKGVIYSASTGWHTDSTHPLKSLGFACYLEPLTRATGALQVIPGSHRDPLGQDLARYLQMNPAAQDLPGYAAETNPGDVILFDEHLFHASAGGARRRQWRVDFLATPKDPASIAAARAYYAGIYPPDWDGGYDAQRFPSYGAHWRQLSQPWNQALERLGAYEAATIEEDAMRAKRPSRAP